MPDPASPPAARRSDGSSLERELAAVEGRHVWRGRLIALAVLASLAGGVALYRWKTRPPPVARFVTAQVTRGDVIETVQSTGAVQPLTQVQVGAQISGRIARVHVDYNSFVHQGDLLAEIDPTLLGATVESNRAQLAAAEAQVTRAKAQLATLEVSLARAERLHVESLASQADVDQVRGQRDVASADLAAASAQIVQTRAQLVYSRTNLAYARVYAPIDGIVISRNIDPGQTVAASFQAPVLFVIAQDLRNMRVLADVDEADVGKLAEGMTAEATVDAFAGEVFRGKVRQVRYNPNTVQGVVTYSAVIDVENPDLKLRPGMTATVTVRTREAKAARKLPNAALRFKPTPPTGPDGKPLPQAPEPPLPPGKARVWVVTDATPGKEKDEPRVIDVGITDGIGTELRSGELDDAAKVVTDETDPQGADAKKSRSRMF